MAVITFPSLKIRSIEWEIDRPAQVSTSQWTGTDQIDPKLWLGRLYCSGEMVPFISEDSVRAWRSFIAGMKGQVNTTRIVAVEKPQHLFSIAQPFAGVAAAGATSLPFTGWTGAANTTPLLAGHLLTVNEQLVILRADAAVNGSGAGTFTFEAPLRKAVTASTPIYTYEPYAYVAFTDSRQGWAAGPGRTYTASFSAKERA